MEGKLLHIYIIIYHCHFETGSVQCQKHQVKCKGEKSLRKKHQNIMWSPNLRTSIVTTLLLSVTTFLSIKFTVAIKNLYLQYSENGDTYIFTLSLKQTYCMFYMF